MPPQTNIPHIHPGVLKFLGNTLLNDPEYEDVLVWYSVIEEGRVGSEMELEDLGGGSWTYLLIKRILEEILFNPKMDHIPPIPEVPLEGGDMLGFGRGRGYKWREMSRDLDIYLPRLHSLSSLQTPSFHSPNPNQPPHLSHDLSLLIGDYLFKPPRDESRDVQVWRAVDRDLDWIREVWEGENGERMGENQEQEQGRSLGCGRRVSEGEEEDELTGRAPTPPITPQTLNSHLKSLFERGEYAQIEALMMVANKFEQKLGRAGLLTPTAGEREG